MGKGNRSRTDRAELTVNTAGTEKSGSNTKLITNITVALVAVLLVGCIALSLVANTGIVLRMQSAASTENFSINGTVMSYYVTTQLNTYLSYFGGSNANYSYSYLKQIKYDSTTGQTLFDYCVEAAVDQVRNMLVLCEYAKSNGIELTDEQYDEIDSLLNDLEEQAFSAGYTVNAYCSALFGKGVNIRDLRRAFELSYLADSAYDHIIEIKENEVTDALIQTYYDEHPELFISADYLSFTFEAELNAAKAEATDEEKAKFEEDKKLMKEYAEKLAKVEGVEAFKTWVIEFLSDYYSSTLFDELWAKQDAKLKEEERPTADKLAEDKAATLKEVLDTLTELNTEDDEEEKEEEEKEEDKKDLTAYEKAIKAVKDEIIKTTTQEFEAITTEGRAHYAKDTKESDISELDQWLFASDRKVGDITTIPSGEDKKDADTVTYTVYIVEETAHRDESITKDVAHILVSFDDYKTGTTITDAEKAKAKEEADKILAEYLAGEKTQDAFEKLGEEKTADSNVVYENVREDEMVAEFNDWIFDEKRTAGETAIVETTYGYHVMYFIGDGMEVWHAIAHNGVLGELYTEWSEGYAEDCNYSYKQSVINSIVNAIS